MRFLITAQPDYDRPPAPAGNSHELDHALFARYMQFNEELQKAGVLVASEGLNGKRTVVVEKNGKRVVKDGPFAETKELVGGFYLIDVPSMDEAVKWALKAPTGVGFDDVLVVHQLTAGADLPPEIIALTEKVAPTWFATFKK